MIDTIAKNTNSDGCLKAMDYLMYGEFLTGLETSISPISTSKSIRRPSNGENSREIGKTRNEISVFDDGGKRRGAMQIVAALYSCKKCVAGFSPGLHPSMSLCRHKGRSRVHDENVISSSKAFSLSTVADNFLWLKFLSGAAPWHFPAGSPMRLITPSTTACQVAQRGCFKIPFYPFFSKDLIVISY